MTDSTNAQSLNPCHYPVYSYRHRWIHWHGSFLCEKCGTVDREHTSPPEMGCPYSESGR